MNQVIPESAIEAAADAMQQFALAKDRDGLQAWDAYAKEALEAASPHMLAEAWEEGRIAGGRSMRQTSPHRTTK